tara:strand:+ start:301 stop:588 length:288 start_codon:yes stop_codon:yes gene_type:complete
MTLLWGRIIFTTGIILGKIPTPLDQTYIERFLQRDLWKKIIFAIFYICIFSLPFIGLMIKKDRLIIMCVVLLLLNLFPISYDITNNEITNIFEQL